MVRWSRDRGGSDSAPSRGQGGAPRTNDLDRDEDEDEDEDEGSVWWR